MSSQQGIKVKTKVVKGPNPLSVKKKIRVNKHQKKGILNESEGEPKKKRIRKRHARADRSD